jgi:uncharacterized protein (DUF58 family)
LPTRTVYELIGTSAALFLPGMFLGNLLLLCMGLVPIFFVFAGLTLVQPKNIEVRRTTGKESVVVGQVVENLVDIEIRDGIGVVVLADEVPKEFELVSGSNFKVIWKGFGPKREQMAYSMRCTKRGVYDLAGVRWESRHPLNLRQTEFGGFGKRRIVVRPRLLDVRKVRSAAVASRIPFPSTTVTKIGPVTMDFRELRPYSPGDPFKFINWKATARGFRHGRFLPVVNDYEREGMKVVWIFLDCSSAMAVGPSVANVFEHAVEVVSGISYYYLRRGCRVGLRTYNGGAATVYPDAGNRQYQRILKELLRIEPGEDWEDLREAVCACRSYAPGCRPLFIVVTRFTKENAAQLLEGMKEMARIAGTAGPRLPVMVVNVSGYGLAARSESERMAGGVLFAECLLAARRFRARVAWVDWDPLQSSFTSSLLAQVVRA